MKAPQTDRIQNLPNNSRQKLSKVNVYRFPVSKIFLFPIIYTWKENCKLEIQVFLHNVQIANFTEKSQ